MKLYKFFITESHAPKKMILFMTIVSGLANGYLLAIINNATATITKGGQMEINELLLFIFDFILLLYTKSYSLRKTVIATEEAINNVRLRLINKLRISELEYIETSDHASIYNRITHDTNTISEASLNIIYAIPQVILVIFSLLYIAWLSVDAFIFISILLALSIFWFMYGARQLGIQLHLFASKQSEFFNDINNVLHGFKEIKINQRKNDALFVHITKTSNGVKNIKMATRLHSVSEGLNSLASYYLVCASAIFVLPVFGSNNAEQVASIVIAILFIWRPINMITTALPMITTTNVALENIYQLEHEISLSCKGMQPGDSYPLEFESLEFEQIFFYYPQKSNDSIFSVGPIDFKVNKGDILFIVGGNGSGKSTLLKILTGLYYPLMGTIYINNKPLLEDDYYDYRDLYSVIFTDFHLFDQLYGVDNIDLNRVNTLLKTMGLDNKTSFNNNGFTNINLSTGQKKRLAYIAAELEDKQIYIFDEWAADQDPEFRLFFYDVLLKDLKAKGKTVIAVSHDDRYFYAADKIIKLDYGQIVDYSI
jgi:putative ATP-binding cassette transporter